MTSLRESTPQIEGVLQVSKWLRIPLLLDTEEMRELLKVLSFPHIFITGKVVGKEEAALSCEAFMEAYTGYVNALKEGEVPSSSLFSALSSTLFTQTSEVLYAQSVREGYCIVKPVRPVIQVQAHQFFFSYVDGKYYSMVLGKESVSWGVQFSYPQLFQDPHTLKIAKVDLSECFPNTLLFRNLTKWMRSKTLPTPFVHKGVKTHVPIRIGKKCLSWIARHPQLKERELEVCYGG